MVRRRWGPVFVLFVAFAAALAVVGHWPTGPRPCRATFEQVEKGMKLDEVIAIVGGPSGNYSHRPHLKLVTTGLSHTPQGWYADDAELVVYFDVLGRADMIYLSDPFPDDRSFSQRVRDRFGL